MADELNSSEPEQAQLPEAARATAVYIVFRNIELDLSWIPSHEKVVVVHNDRSLEPSSCHHPRVEHVFSVENVGFGAAVNDALEHVDTERLVICNPDTVLASEHWQALTRATPQEIVTLPLVQPDGTPTSVVNRYPAAISHLLTSWRVGRLFRQGGVIRRTLVPLLGRWGRAHGNFLVDPHGEWPLSSYWASGAVLSVDTARFTAVGGFDEAYFLYFEDVDLCRRLAHKFPEMVLRLPPGKPALHLVGGSAADPVTKRMAERHFLISALRWSRAQPGWRWRIVGLLLIPRSWWLGRRR